MIGGGESVAQQRMLAGMLATMRHDSFYTSGSLSIVDDGVLIGWIAHPGSFAESVSRYRHPDGSAVVMSGECIGQLPGLGRRPLDAPEAFAAALIDGTRAQGSDYLRHLNGLFSGVLVDRKLRRTLVFNDRFGAERLYAGRLGDLHLFCSEAKAVLHAAPASRKLDLESVAQWMKFGSVLDNRTLFAGVRLLPGGSVVSATPSGIQSWGRYFDPVEWESQSPLSLERFGAVLADAVAEVVPEYLEGGRPIGFAITGGLDTRMIAAALPGAPTNLHCYTYGVSGRETLDQRIGRKVAKLCGLSHDSVLLEDGWLADFPRHLERTVWITDGCAGATTTHELPLTEKSRALGSVRLTGNFGSEVLRGVSTLKPWQPARGFVSRDFEASLGRAVPAKRAQHPVTRAAFEEIPWHLFGSMAAGRSQVTFRTPYLDNRIVKLAYQLAIADRDSPWPSTEVIRRLRPSLTAVATDRGVSLESGRGSTVFQRGTAEIMFKLDYWDKEGLPGPLWMLDPVLGILRQTPWMGLHKYLAYRRWFRKELGQLIEHIASDCEDLSEIIDRNFVDQIAGRHGSGRYNLLREINCVLTLSTIQRLFIGEHSGS